MYSAWFNRTDVSSVFVPASCCVDRPTIDSAGSVLSAAKVIDCQLMAERYIRNVNNPKGPDPNLLGRLHFLQTQVGFRFRSRQKRALVCLAFYGVTNGDYRRCSNDVLHITLL